MLAEIEGSSFTARGRSECIMQLNLVPSEGRLDERSWEQKFLLHAAKHLCRAASCLLWRANHLFRESQNQS